MIDPLYQKEILRLAAAADGAGQLPDPSGSATVKNPLCGDQIAIDVLVNGERLDAMAHVTRACVLCQASAALLSRLSKGQDMTAIGKAETALKTLLNGGASLAWPEGFSAFEVFAVAVPHKNRHTCVILPFEALRKAVSAANAPVTPAD